MTSQNEADLKAQQELAANGNVPEHIAVIMDGNGRWAKQKGLHRIQGHKEGVESVRDIVDACAQVGVRYLTLYTFSMENWNRPVSEINALMELLIRTLRKEMDTFLEKGVRLQSIGNWSELPVAAQRELEESITASSENERITLILALSYSGRWEIIEATRALARRARDGYLDPDSIDESMISQALETVTVPDPDLLIRTGGDIRVSNFLLWQIAYSELYFTDVYWPDFRRKQLYDA
ncbi:MAG: polyprenyl diphosphate synthase, partial [Bacteroidetes bacterium]|nr:polyprenyl diphosphate synthase [Bacteroidota bacterium]